MAIRRLATLARHLHPSPASSPSASSAWGLAEVRLGDTPAAWQAAGFSVVDGDTVRLPNLTVRLGGPGGRRGLRELVLAAPDDGEGADAPRAPPVVEGLAVSTVARAAGAGAATNAGAGAGAAVQHPNTATHMREMVLYARDIRGLVDGFAAAGIGTHKGRPPTPITTGVWHSGRHLAASFLLTGNAPPLRLVVVGPTDARDCDAHHPARPEPDWRLGRLEDGPFDVTGWLPVVRDIEAARAAAFCCGRAKDAVQPGRKIATVRFGKLPGLSATLAFLSERQQEEGGAAGGSQAADMKWEI